MFCCNTTIKINETFKTTVSQIFNNPSALLKSVKIMEIEFIFLSKWGKMFENTMDSHKVNLYCIYTGRISISINQN